MLCYCNDNADNFILISLKSQSTTMISDYDNNYDTFTGNTIMSVSDNCPTLAMK